MSQFWCYSCEAVALEGDHECPVECDVCLEKVAPEDITESQGQTICLDCLQKRVERETERHP